MAFETLIVALQFPHPPNCFTRKMFLAELILKRFLAEDSLQVTAASFEMTAVSFDMTELNCRSFNRCILSWYGRPNPEDQINRQPKDRIFDRRTE